MDRRKRLCKKKQDGEHAVPRYVATAPTENADVRDKI